jgi:hypothetical protein
MGLGFQGFESGLGQPGFGKPIPPPVPPSDSLDTLALAMLQSNLQPASGDLLRTWMTAAPQYSANGQYIWDSAYGALALAVLGDTTNAQNVLRNWVDQQLVNGMLPHSVSASDSETNFSGLPVLSDVVWRIYQLSSDETWLAIMYPCLTAYHGWWEAHRQDTSGLCCWGSSRGGSPSDAQVVQDASLESFDRSWFTDFHSGFYGAASGALIDHCCPALNALLVADADAISNIATALGETADATTYAAKRDARKAAMNTFMWDEEYGCYFPLLRNDLGRNIGQLTAAAGSTVTVDGSISVPFILAPGERINTSSGNSAQASVYTYIGVTPDPLPTISLMSALSGGTTPTVGDYCNARSFSYTKNLATLMLPLFAGVADATRAGRIVNEHLTKVHDGSAAEVCELFFADSMYAKRTLKMKRTPWRPFFSNYSFGVAEVDINGAGRVLGITLDYRGSAILNVDNGDAAIGDDQIFNASWETLSVLKPLKVRAWWIPNDPVTPEVVLTDTNGTTYSVTLSTSAVSGGLETGEAVFTDAVIPAKVDIYKVAGGSSLGIQKVQVETYPEGWEWLSGTGAVYTSRLGDQFIGNLAARADENANISYWKGDCWVPLEWWTVKALERFSFTSEAADLAAAVQARVLSEALATDSIWERYGPNGDASGFPDNAFTALAVDL